MLNSCPGLFGVVAEPGALQVHGVSASTGDTGSVLWQPKAGYGRVQARLKQIGGLQDTPNRIERHGEIKLESARSEENTTKYKKVGLSGARGLAAITFSRLPSVAAGAALTEEEDADEENGYVFWAMTITMIIGLATVVTWFYRVVRLAAHWCCRRQLGRHGGVPVRSRGAAGVVARAAGRAACNTR